jgi:hypothetical protein
MIGDTWQERVLKRSGVVRNGKRNELNSSASMSPAYGAARPLPSRTTHPSTPTRMQGSILICTFQSVCPYAESVTLPCIRDSTSALSAKPDTPSTMCAGHAFHQMSNETRKLLKRSGEEYEEKVIRREDNFTKRLDSGWLDERVVFFREMKHMKFKEIGKELGITTDAANGRYRRIKEREGGT